MIDNRVVEAVTAASRVGTLAASHLQGPYGRHLDRLPPAIRDAMVINGVLSYLIGRGYLAPTETLLGPDDGWTELDLPPGLAELFEAALRVSVDRQDRIEANVHPGRYSEESGPRHARRARPAP